MDAKSAVELMESSNEVHFSGFHMDGFEQRKASIEQLTTSETDMYKQPFVIGVFSCANCQISSHEVLKLCYGVHEQNHYC